MFHAFFCAKTAAYVWVDIEPWCQYCEVEVETLIHLVETCSLLTPLRIEISEDYMPSLTHSLRD